MSFSAEVREELLKHFTKKQECQRAELAALIMFNSKALTLDRETGVYIYNDNRSGINEEESTLNHQKKFSVDFDASKGIEELIKKPAEKRAFLRGAFIACGTISSPEGDYHFEYLAPDEGTANLLQQMMESFDVPAKIARRRGKFQVYVKDAEKIADMLNICEAHVALMEFEEVRVERSLRGSVNRKLNCDSANINKSVNAAMKQIDDIELIRDTIGLESLSQPLQEIVAVRLQNPDAPLAELGELLVPKVGKSGVNHRMRKLREMADKIRERQGGQL